MIKITYFGSERDIADTIMVLKQHENISKMKEADARLLIQKFIDEHRLRASILVNGNRVWSKDRILRNLERIMKLGTLYNEDQTKPPILSRYFYEFLSQDCGSIAYYDIHGWIHKYPTVEHLKKFFRHNEFGKRVLDWIPPQHTDAKAIVQQIEILLFPFASFMKAREEATTKPKRK